MALVINTNVSAINAGRTLSRSTSALSRSLQQLSSGLRINSARDDAAGLAIAEGFNSVVRGSQVAQRNAQDGISMVQTAEGALGETTSILQRMRELAVQSANGTMTTNSRAAIQEEIDELYSQLDSIAQDTEFNGLRVLSSNQTITLQTGAQKGQDMAVVTKGAGAKSLLANATAINVSTAAQATSAMSTLDNAIQSVSSLRATLGAFQNRLEFTINTLAIQEENSAASESAIRDADMARVTTEFTRTQILVSAGTSVLAQANVMPQTALTLLG